MLKESENINFYEFLGIDPKQLPYPDSKENRIKLKLILDTKFKELAPKMHPDRGGSQEKFKALLRAITVLGDEKLRSEYDGVSYSVFNDAAFFVDWEKYFSYDPNTLAADFGHNFSMKIARKLNTKLVFYPEMKEHGYNWSFDIEYNGKFLTLSLVYDEDEILALTSGESVEKSLPFKIHLFFPMDRLKVSYDHSSAVKVPETNKYLVMPMAKSVQYSDVTLATTTNESMFSNYVENNLVQDMENLLAGKPISNELYEESNKNALSQQALREQDLKVLHEIFRLKTPHLTPNETADEFIARIPDRQIKRITEKTITVKTKEK